MERGSETKSVKCENWVYDGEVTPILWVIFKKYDNEDKIFDSICVKELCGCCLTVGNHIYL